MGHTQFRRRPAPQQQLDVLVVDLEDPTLESGDGGRGDFAVANLDGVAVDIGAVMTAGVTALNRTPRLSQDTGIGLLFVVGEENGSDGARAAADLGPRGRFLINGEPTESRLASGAKGSQRVIVRTRGREAHSAYPHLGQSAIVFLGPVVSDPPSPQGTFEIGLPLVPFGQEAWTSGTSQVYEFEMTLAADTPDTMQGSSTGSLLVEDVAHRLGYAESSSFGVAYQRWTGRSPRSGR